MQYDPKEIEQKWRQKWRADKTYKVENDTSKPKFYVLDMFPYPSGAGLHVGHPLGYIASDIVARFKRHNGFNVLHPMGYDSFGLPAEQYAIQTGQHPAKTTEVNIARYREQLDNIAFSFDWDREVRTSDPSYYKWTQWIFIQLFESWYDHEQQQARPIAELVDRFAQWGWSVTDPSVLTGDVEEDLDPFTADDWNTFDERAQREILQVFRLAYLSEAWVNWCPALGTVLANDEVKDGVSERGGHPVERKRMPQWSMRITAYAQRLLDGLDGLDWSESIKESQRNWIGRSEGALVRFALRLTPALSGGEGVAGLTPNPSPVERGGESLTPALSGGEGVAGLTPNPSPVERGANAQREVDLRYDTANWKLYAELQSRAKAMRHEPTEAESILWAKLRNHQLGEKFRRQHVLQDFIADLVCLPRTLIVEVDGGIHQENEGYDAYRTQQLEAHDFKVIRFSNEDVIHRTDEVLKKISEELKARPLRHWPEGTHTPARSSDISESAHSPLSTGEGRGEAHFTPLHRRGEGGEAAFPFSGGEGLGVRPHSSIEVFTTRPDTLFGVTFVTLAPEHELVEQITPPERREEVMAYVTQAKNRSERDRMADVKKVSGVFTGAYCIHPFTGAEVPIWVGDYVLGGYGTGAVMAVPGGDQRDWNFATHFGLPIIAVTEGADISKEADERKDATISSEGFLKGLKVPDAMKRSIDELVKLGAGTRRINYRLRDAAFGRQRYWGEPIPIYYKDGIPYALPESELPLKLPEVDKFLPTEDGEPPLARAKSWYYTPSSATGAKDNAHSPLSTGEGSGVRPHSNESAFPLETTTMPGWAGSSWYFLRYMDPKNEDRFASPEAINYWQQVDLYMGGSEHATGHLLYFRFWTKFLKDRGYINFDEPAKKLVNQGMIQGNSRFVFRMDYYPKWASPSSHKPDDVGYEEIVSDMFHYTMEHVPITFLSKEVRNEFVHGVISQAEIVDWAKEQSPRIQEVLDEYHTEIDVASVRVTPIHVDVSYVEGEVLNPELFQSWRSEFRGANLLKRGADYICGAEVEKMSKSKYNVVNPDDIISKYGADTLRLYEMFLGPIEQSKPWDTNGIEGTFRFLRKFWNLFHADAGAANAPPTSDAPVASTLRVDTLRITNEAPTKPELKILHATLKKVTEDIEKMSFNTSVSQFMIAVNELGTLKCHKRDVLEPLTIALAPFAPHIAEELWSQLGHTESITTAHWPKWDEQYLVEDNFSYPISFNGKTRLQLEFPIALDAKSVEAAVLANPEVQLRLEGKAPKKVIVVPKRIVNIVV